MQDWPINPEDYGLNDENVLKQAAQMAPELFAALVISKNISPSTYPITSDREIEGALSSLLEGKDSRLEFPGVRISPEGAKENFPNDFLPVIDALDLFKKVYLAILIHHEEQARKDREALNLSLSQLKASHPLPEVF